MIFNNYKIIMTKFFNNLTTYNSESKNKKLTNNNLNHIKCKKIKILVNLKTLINY